MKAGWEVKALGGVCTVEKSQMGAQQLPYVGLEDLVANAGGFIGSRDPQSVKSTTFIFSNKHVIYGRLRPYLNKVHLPDFDGHCSSEIFPIMPNKNLDRRFLYYWLISASTVNRINETSTGARMPRANINAILTFDFPLPPLEEQKRIVAVLDGAFEGLDRARTHIQTNLQNARELFDALLLETLRSRYPITRTVTLGDVCKLAQGLAINKNSKKLLVAYSSKPLLRIKDLRSSTVEQYVAETGFPPNAEVTPKDIIYTRTGQIGLVFRGFAGVLHNNCFSVRAFNGLNQDYCFWWLQEPVFRQQIMDLASRAAQPDITHKIFKAQEIMLPDASDQISSVERIEQAFSDLQMLQADYRTKLADLDDLRQSLLQKAFVGELT